jgi:hypothetical protein
MQQAGDRDWRERDAASEGKGIAVCWQNRAEDVSF